MKRCIYLGEQTPNRMTSWVLLVGFSAILLFFLWIGLTGGVAQAWIIAFMLMCALWFFVIPGWLMNTRTYRVTEQGIETGGLLRRTELHPWTQVHSIGVYTYAATASRRGSLSGIFVFLEPVPDYFVQDAKQGYYFLARRHRSLILIDHSAPALEELSAAYPGEIHDHRH